MRPAGRRGRVQHRPRRGVLAGLDDVPGVTVNRYCSSSLQTIRMAAHAIRAGEGDCFIAAGVETTSRFFAGSLRRSPWHAQPAYSPSPRRTPPSGAEGGAPPWAPSQGLPDIYIAMGQTAENVAEYENVSREEMDEFAALSQTGPSRARRTGSSSGRSRRTPSPTAPSSRKDDGPRAGTTVEGLAKLQPVFRPDGAVTAGNACPLNDGAAAVVVMSDTRAAELGIRPLARIVSSGVSALDPEIMGLGPIEASRQALGRPA